MAPLAWLMPSTVSPSASAVTVRTRRLPVRSMSLPMPMQKSEPTSVATRLICAKVDAADAEVAQQRLGDEPQALRAARKRADHGQRGHAEHDPAVVEAFAYSRRAVDLNPASATLGLLASTIPRAATEDTKNL